MSNSTTATKPEPLPVDTKTILGALAHHCATRPDFQALTWVDVNCKETNKMTYKELDEASNTVAAHLLKIGCKKGDRVMIAYPFGLEFLAGLFGCMKIGVIGCSIYPPNPAKNVKAEMEKFRGYVEDAGAKISLSSNAFAVAMKAVGLVYKSKVTWIGTDHFGKPSKSMSKKIQKSIASITERDVAFIQYTSGSTGTPKGVVIGHEALVENTKALTADVIGVVPGKSVACYWVPQYHDMGLISGFMSSLYSGGKLIATSPLDFVTRPLLWCDMIEKYKADVTCAPNFSYALLMKRLEQAGRKADWSHVKQAVFGGEPTQKGVVSQVIKQLGVKPEHVYQSYGMAESVVFLTGGVAEIADDGLVSCGATLSPTVTLRIVSEGKVLPDGEVGTIWAQSLRVADGYYGREELTTATFKNTLPGEDGFWLNTGDLGKIMDGRLYVTGRVKDVIIVNGKNFYPTDIELSIEKEFDKLIRPGRSAAFQMADDTVGVILEARNAKAIKGSSVAVDISNHILQEHGLSAEKVLVMAPGAAPKTTSGKLKRSEIRTRTVQNTWDEKMIVLCHESTKPASPRLSHLEKQFSTRGINSSGRYLSQEMEQEISRSMALQKASSHAALSPFSKSAHVVVLGGGAAGLICALRLAQRGQKVTLLERNAWIGGHARHAEVFGGHLRNPAFGAFIEKEWPNLVKLTDELGVKRIRICKVKEGRSALALDGHTLPDVSEEEVSRFLADMYRLHQSQENPERTLGEFLEEANYDEEFVVQFLCGKAICFFAGQTIQNYLDYPVNLFAWYMVAASPKETLYRLCNKDYMEAFQAKLEQYGVQVRTGVDAQLESRDGSGVTLRLDSEDGELIKADKMVLAMPPNAAAQFLEGHNSSSEGALSQIDCPLETVVLHQDPKWVKGTEGEALAALLPNKGAPLPSRSDTVPITTNFVSDLDNKTKIYCTHAYQTLDDLDISGPAENFTFTHTRMTTATVSHREALLMQQGQNNTYFAGGWTRGLMLHEDALVSGTDAANKILVSMASQPFKILERATPVDPTKTSSRGHNSVGKSKDLASLVQAVLGSAPDMSRTWGELGLASVQQAELVSKIQQQFHVELPPNFPAIYATPQELEAHLLCSKGKSFEVLEHTDGLTVPTLSKTTLAFLQGIGILVMVFILALSFVPSYFIGKEISKFAITFEIGSSGRFATWSCMPFVVPIFCLSFTLVVVVLKYLVIGKYKAQQYQVHSWQFLRWWFVDRLMNMWEMFVGQFLVETKVLWFVYTLMGAKIHPSVDVESYIREFDLIEIGPGSKVKHQLRCKKFRLWEITQESPVMVLRPITIGANSEVKGMVGPGCKVGDNCLIESLSAVAEGSVVPDGALARGAPAYNAGTAPKDPAWQWSWQLDIIKLIWMIAQTYLWFGLFVVAQVVMNDQLPSTWRYTPLLYWFLILALTALFGVLVSIAMKWILIGRRNPDQKDNNTSYWYDAALWICDFHFRLCMLTLMPFSGASMFWLVVLKLHGLRIDLVSVFNGPECFPPSKVDLIKVERSFVSVPSFDIDVRKGLIEIIDSSIGWNVRIHSGVKIVRSTIPPKTTIKESIFDSNQKHYEGNYMSRIIFSLTNELTQLVLNVIIFFAFIPSYEVFTNTVYGTSTGVALLGIWLSLLMHVVVFHPLLRLVQWMTLNAPSRIREAVFGLYIIHTWANKDWNFWYLLHGTPMFPYWLRAMGAEVTGSLWYFGYTVYDMERLHFVGDRVVVDDSNIHAHSVVGGALELQDTYVRGLIHPGSYAHAGSNLADQEHQPYTVFHSTSTVASSKKTGAETTLNETSDSNIVEEV